MTDSSDGRPVAQANETADLGGVTDRVKAEAAARAAVQGGIVASDRANAEASRERIKARQDHHEAQRGYRRAGTSLAGATKTIGTVKPDSPSMKFACNQLGALTSAFTQAGIDYSGARDLLQRLAPDDQATFDQGTAELQRDTAEGLAAAKEAAGTCNRAGYSTGPS